MYKEQLKLNMKIQDLIEVFEQMYDGFLLSSIDGRIFYANPAVEDISGIPINQIVGKTSKELEGEGLIKASTRVSSNAPITMVHHLKTGRKVFITSKPIYDENGAIMCFAANYHDLDTLQYLENLHNEEKPSDFTKITKQDKEQVIDHWIGDSFKTTQLKEKVMRIARTEALVLIVGDSGVGKEVIANAIHQLSRRKEYSYIKINCGAIPEDLIEAELFGYEKGAFTGANTSKKGLFEAANGGTVLLDEIGEMPSQLQVKLLRVIQTKKITRIGGTKEKSLDIRIIAATNQDLVKQIEKGDFREDLYYRLNVIPIYIPTLKDRKDDIIPLTDFFLSKFNRKYQMQKSFSPETLQLLQEYDWPGNVRELENVIERLVIMTDEQIVTANFLPDEFKRKHHSPMDDIQPLKEVTKEAEIKAIQLALNKYGSLRKAAKVLKVHHSTLVRKVDKYNIK